MSAHGFCNGCPAEFPAEHIGNQCTDCGETVYECGDEGRLCSPCEEREAAIWFRYFGLRADMSRAEYRAQLEKFAPPGRSVYRNADGVRPDDQDERR